MQHPEQFHGPQLGPPVHTPALQFWLNAAQSWHCMPPKPHAVELPPKVQMSPWQHPGQLPGPHGGGGGWQTLPTHASPKLKQSWHCPPP
jgi:hypothetical protein